MAEQSKFSGALAKLGQRPAEPPAPQEAAPAPSPAPPPSAAVAPARTAGRPPGKRSNPDYEQTSVLLRKQTKKKASRLLEDADMGQDLSDLVEQLLTEWIERKS